DDYYNGSDPGVVFFDKDGKPIPNGTNIAPYNSITNPAASRMGSYDQTANNTLRSAGAGFWHLSAYEYAKFITKFWNNEIVSASSVAEIAGKVWDLNVAPDANIGFGNYAAGLRLASETSAHIGFGHNGGGWLGGPAAAWHTSFNKYTAVLIMNTRPSFARGAS